MDLEKNIILENHKLIQLKLKENEQKFKKLEIRDKLICKLFNILNIIIDTPSDMIGIEIPSEILYNIGIKKKFLNLVPELKKYYSSSYFTSLQTSAFSKPFFAVNLLRQVVRSYGLRLRTRNKSAGYTPSGKKIYNRTYEIKDF